MKTVDIHAAEADFARLADEAAAGEEIIIAKAGKPVARLGPLDAGPERPKRILGALAGRAVFPPDFDLPLPDAVIDPFEGRL